ncbi:transcription factor SPT20 homolog [Daktulosphaira vitifoliae]|uniref:transcription factor SPT20 homolog n=1 Tax=Daktulosphaira vitifoliae TaxID=58002 RepID=UPI0021AA24B5|nr:transcription factor SPT20 homolog [Daktulosphaira vitifoliae]
MDESCIDQKINDTQSDVKQKCMENTNSLPLSGDNCVNSKKTSFEITSITEPNNIDDNDDDSPDTEPHSHDNRADIRHDVDLQNYADNMVVYNTCNDMGSSAPVIPTSSQYGLAIVDNLDSVHSLGSTKNDDNHGTDLSLQKSDCDVNGLQNKNRNERFKVVKIESTEPFKRGRWVCMDFLDHSMNQQPGNNNKSSMVNGESKTYPQINDIETPDPVDNGHHECPEYRVSTNNVSTYTTNCNNSDNYKSQTSTYSIVVSSGVTTPIHSACVSPGQTLQTNMQVPVLTSQSIISSVQVTQPQSLSQVQLPTQHNISQNCMQHSSLQPHQLQQVMANAGIVQPQLQQTQPTLGVLHSQNQPIQPQPIQHMNSVEQHNVSQSIPPQYQPSLSQVNLQQQIMQHNMSAQFQKTYVPQNQSVLPNCAPLQQSMNQIINQVPQYYNSPSVQTQNVSSEPSSVSMSNQHITPQQFQSIPMQTQSLQNHVQLQQNQQQLPPVQQIQQQTSQQQPIVPQNQMNPQIVQQNPQLTHQSSISQPSQSQSVPQQVSQQHIQQSPQTQQTHVQQVSSSQQQQQGPQQIQQVNQQNQSPQISQIHQQLPQQTHHMTQISQMTNQSQSMPQTNQMQQISLQTQQIPQAQLQQHSKQIQQAQIQSQSQQINQQQISQQQINQITSQNQIIHQNNQQIPHPSQMMSQGQPLNPQNQQVQQQQSQQQIQLTQTSQSGQSMSQQILQSNPNMPQQNQVITQPQQLGMTQSNTTMVSPSQNQQVVQTQHMQQSNQQYQQAQQIMQSQGQQIPIQSNQSIMHQPTYSQAQSLNAIQLQQAVMQIPPNTVTSSQMHVQQQPQLVQSMLQQSQMSMSQNNMQSPIPPMSQQQMTYSLQQHVPINSSYVDSIQHCYIPSQQQMSTYKPLVTTVEAINPQQEDNINEDVDSASHNAATTVAIDNKIEQAMDLVKSHLMYAVREEVEVLKEKIAELMDKVGLLETENSNLRMLVPPEILDQYNREKQKPTNSQSTHN